MVFRRWLMMPPELHTAATIWAVCQEDGCTVPSLPTPHAVVEATHDPAWRWHRQHSPGLLLLAGHGLDSKCEEERVGCLSQNATDIA